MGFRLLPGINKFIIMLGEKGRQKGKTLFAHLQTIILPLLGFQTRMFRFNNSNLQQNNSELMIQNVFAYPKFPTQLFNAKPTISL